MRDAWKGEDLREEHDASCDCPRCMGIPSDEWEEEQRRLPNGGRILTREEVLTKEQQMIKVQRNNAPTGSSTPRGVQFLSPKHVTSPDGFIATIAKVTTDKPDNYGNPYVVFFTAGPSKYSKGFRETSANLATLVDMLGDDERKWIGKQVRIAKVTDDEGAESLAFHPVKGGR